MNAPCPTHGYTFTFMERPEQVYFVVMHRDDEGDIILIIRIILYYNYQL